MQRKVIQIGNSTQLISLPRKWAIHHGIKKGDTLEVNEQGNSVLVTTEKGISLQNIELDISGLDRSSIIQLIRALYRMGYNSISLKFKNTTTPHFRLKHDEKVLSVIHNEVNRLVGVEVIKQTENFCLIKSISQGSIKEFDTILRRIFLLSRDAHYELIKSLEKNDCVLLETMEEKHNTISKFVSYCLRLINKHGYSDERKKDFIYHIIASFDSFAGVIKDVSRDGLAYNKPMSKAGNKILDLTHKAVISHYEFFYKFDKDKVIEFMRIRDNVKEIVKDNLKKIPPEENIMINRMEQNLNTLIDLIGARMSLRY